jgi:hypothetical protein
MLPPGQVHELGIDAAAENLRVAILELMVELTEGRDLGWADESEILGPEEIDLPLALVVFARDGLKSLPLFEADCRLKGKGRKLLANS